MIDRICSRPGLVPTPMPTVTATMKTIVSSVKALTRTTRWRRFIELEVRSDGEGEGEPLQEPGAPRRVERRGTGRRAHLREQSPLIARVRDGVARRHAQQSGHVRVVVQRSCFAL